MTEIVGDTLQISDPRVQELFRIAVELASPHRRVARTAISRWEVMTTWIPTMDFNNVSAWQAERRGYFETMVFGPQDAFDVGGVPEILRCSARDIAAQQHKFVVVLLAVYAQLDLPRERRHGLVRHLRSVQRHLAKQGLYLPVPLHKPIPPSGPVS